MGLIVATRDKRRQGTVPAHQATKINNKKTTRMWQWSRLLCPRHPCIVQMTTELKKSNKCQSLWSPSCTRKLLGFLQAVCITSALLKQSQHAYWKTFICNFCKESSLIWFSKVFTKQWVMIKIIRTQTQTTKLSGVSSPVMKKWHSKLKTISLSKKVLVKVYHKRSHNTKMIAIGERSRKSQVISE